MHVSHRARATVAEQLVSFGLSRVVWADCSTAAGSSTCLPYIVDQRHPPTPLLGLLSLKLHHAALILSPPLQSNPAACFPLGTHVGFQDQLMLGDKEVDQDILPIVDLILTLLSIAIAAGFRFDTQQSKWVINAV